ncbi:Uncharacterised protein [Mycobacteroides abscessus subsp. abscessus]|nr:Uncharacterised protein [Mycobacteroides abscessus subsp. abscessus]
MPTGYLAEFIAALRCEAGTRWVLEDGLRDEGASAGVRQRLVESIGTNAVDVQRNSDRPQTRRACRGCRAGIAR